MGSKITAIEYCFPENKLTNADLAIEFPDYDFQKFEEKVGISIRYIADKDQTALDLAVLACEKLFQNISRNDIDYILYCTQSPEYILPTTACILQDRLGLNKNIGAFDFNLGCSGYTYGVSMAKGLINSGQAKNILLVTAETYSKFLHPLDRSNRAIFGDAATATLISYSEEDKIGNFLFGTDGSGFGKLIIKNGASKYGYVQDPELIVYGTDNTYTENHLYMNGPEIFDFTNENIPPFTEKLLTANNIEKTAVDQYIFHQANAYMLTFMRRRLKITPEKFYINLAQGGNTVSCTIPIALKDYSATMTEGERQNIMIVGFGVGLSWSGGQVQIDTKL
ncbi:MAG TPA: ketoacyl-ACP synthase III [Flavobacterium sp.]|jgi:3-oxoacyl-[acyl-carrier-protein] synthase-3|nr:ketoacyl-ACP synthase III [Flavobacterium sp.]